MTDTTTAARPAHTPGPWTVNPIRPVQVATDADTPQLVATAVADGDPYTAIADARLIAAAPELLEALHQLIVVIGLTAIKYKSDLDTVQEAVDEARAVIAKATGSAS